eukprot:9685369-Karenia_brevis.AAC.1
MITVSKESGRQGESIAEYAVTNIMRWGGKKIKGYQSINNKPFFNASPRGPPDVQRRMKTQDHGLRNLSKPKK